MSKNCNTGPVAGGVVLDGVVIRPLSWKLVGGQWVANCCILGDELRIALAGVLWRDISEYGFFNLPGTNVDEVKGRVEQMRLGRILKLLGGEVRGAGVSQAPDMQRLASHVEWLRGDHEGCNPWLAGDIEALLFRAESAERREAALLSSNQVEREAQVENASLRQRVQFLERELRVHAETREAANIEAPGLLPEVEGASN